MARSLLGRGVAAFLAADVGGVALFWMFVVLWRTYDRALIGVLAMLFFLLLVPAAVLFADGSWFSRGLLLLRDLRRGSVKVFSGPLTEADRLQVDNTVDGLQYRLLAWELLKIDNGTQTLEVLPLSRCIWQTNSARVTPWIRAAWKEIAKPPEAGRVGQPSERTPLPSQWAGERRRMSERERAELFREARRHWQSPAFWAFVLSAFLIGAVVEALTSHPTLKSIPKWGSGIHLLWLVPTVDTYAVRRWREARRMFQDVRQGEVEILRSQDSAAGVSERLPISDRPWTQSGRPAAWRQMWE